MKPHELLLGDCLQRLRDVADDSVDMVLCDPPYGTTACKWDEVIPFAPHVERNKEGYKRRIGCSIYSFAAFYQRTRYE